MLLKTTSDLNTSNLMQFFLLEIHIILTNTQNEVEKY